VCQVCFLKDHDESQACRFLNEVESEPRDLGSPKHERLLMHCVNEIHDSHKTANSNLGRLLGTWRAGSRNGRRSNAILFECDFIRLQIDRSSFTAREMEYPEQLVEHSLTGGKSFGDLERNLPRSLSGRQILSSKLIDHFNILAETHDERQ